MSRKDKLFQKLKSCSKDFSFDELITLMSLLGYELENRGKTSGSRFVFKKNRYKSIFIHRPHAYKYLLISQVNCIKKILMEDKQI